MSSTGADLLRVPTQEPDGNYLTLTRTRSTALTIAESIAVREVSEGEMKSMVDDDEAVLDKPRFAHSVRYLVMLCAFLTSTSFGVTQVPLLYVFRLIICDVYYQDHPDRLPSAGDSPSIMSYAFNPLLGSTGVDINKSRDRCSVHSIESSTALNISILGATTTVFGIINLFWTGALIKKLGLKWALLLNVAFPAARLLIQNIGVEVWGNSGILIIQLSQIVSVIGGPSGYLLVLNSFITEVVGYDERTAGLGRVAGSMMAGAALGFLLGGLIADRFGIHAPFRVTLVLFLISSIYVFVFLPNIPPAKSPVPDGLTGTKKGKGPIRKILQPLIVFGPKKFITPEGKIQTEYGTFLLACGVFLGILATGYLPTLLQLYSTDVFGFAPAENGWLIFMFSLLRGAFLTFGFPQIIALGRRFMAWRDGRRAARMNISEPTERDPLIGVTTDDNADDAQAVIADNAAHQDGVFEFDLIYTRISMLVDGALTFCCMFVQEGWQMYIIAAVLPFGAGTGSAAKGTALQMVGATASREERTDALAGISLVENIGRLSTTFVFGVVFAAFANIGRHELVFTANAAVAVFSFFALLLARFPPKGSRRYHKEEEQTTETTQT